MNFFETSAKTNQNVNEVFTFLTQEILKNMKSSGGWQGSDNIVKINNKKNKRNYFVNKWVKLTLKICTFKFCSYI